MNIGEILTLHEVYDLFVATVIKGGLGFSHSAICSNRLTSDLADLSARSDRNASQPLWALSGKVDRLGFEIGIETLGATFPSYAGLLISTKWRDGIDLQAIDTDVTRAHLTGDMLGPRDIL